MKAKFAIYIGLLVALIFGPQLVINVPRALAYVCCVNNGNCGAGLHCGGCGNLSNECNTIPYGGNCCINDNPALVPTTTCAGLYQQCPSDARCCPGMVCRANACQWPLALPSPTVGPGPTNPPQGSCNSPNWCTSHDYCVNTSQGSDQGHVGCGGTDICCAPPGSPPPGCTYNCACGCICPGNTDNCNGYPSWRGGLKQNPDGSWGPGPDCGGWFTQEARDGCWAAGWNDCRQGQPPLTYSDYISPLAGTYPPGKYHFYWTAATQATAYYFALDDLTNTWSNNCASPNAGDVCLRAAALSAGDYDLLAGRQYQWWVTPVNNCNGGPQSGSLTKVTLDICTLPQAPTNVRFQDNVFQLKVLWDDETTDETGFVISRSTDQLNWTDIGTTGPIAGSGGTGEYIDTSLTCGNYYYYAVQTLGVGIAGCDRSPRAIAVGTCLDFKPWFGVGGGDVISATGRLNSNMLQIDPPPYFMDNDALSLRPGMILGQSADSGMPWSYPQLSSTTKWLSVINPSWDLATKKDILYQSMADRLTAQATPVEVLDGNSDITTQAQWNLLVNSAADLAHNRITLSNIAGPNNTVVILRRKGNMVFDAPIDVTDGGVNNQNKKVVLLVDGDVIVNGNLNISNDNDGFFALLVGGSITINGNVGEPVYQDIRLPSFQPHLEGIFFAQTSFYTGSSDRQLRVDGSVVAMSRIFMNRSKKGNFPAEYFKFRPEYTNILSNLGVRRKYIKSVGAP